MVSLVNGGTAYFKTKTDYTSTQIRHICDICGVWRFTQPPHIYIVLIDRHTCGLPRNNQQDMRRKALGLPRAC
jgi:hypothetical protein